MPVFDLKIHPRDHELIAATHGRGFWIVDVAPLEQITPKTLADAATLFVPRTAFQWGEGPQLGMPGNGWGQAPLVIPAPGVWCDDLVSFQGFGERAGASVTVSDAGGTQLYTTTGHRGAGLHNVNWAFQAAPAPRAALAPAARRDSILFAAARRWCSIRSQKAGYDTAR